MELDKAFEFAVILSWADLMKVVTPAAVRVEYRCESDSRLDHVTVWTDKGKGNCLRVCDFWTWASSTHRDGIHFRTGHDSDQLAQALDFIMRNQDQFTSPMAARNGLVLVFPPGNGERATAATWRQGALGTSTPSLSSSQVYA